MTTPTPIALARPEIEGIPVYNAGPSNEMVQARYGVTHIARLASNENPFGPSPQVVKALAQLTAKIGDYPDANATHLRQAIATGTGVPAPRIVFGNGSEELIKLLCEIFVRPGELVVTQHPAFGLHQIYPEMMGAHVELLDLTESMEFDVPAWCKALAKRPKVAFLPNPSNPVGCMIDASGLAEILQATSDETVLVVDEAYHEYARLAEGYPDVLAMLAKRSGPWIVLRTFSKAWALAGLRVGYGLASDEELVGLLAKVRPPFNLNTAAQYSALAAWQDSAHMQATVAKTVQLRKAMAEQLHALTQAGGPLVGMRIAPSVANFLFLDLGQPSGPVAEALVAQGIIVKPWKDKGYTNYLRVTIGNEEDNGRFVKALVEVIAKTDRAQGKTAGEAVALEGRA